MGSYLQLDEARLRELLAALGRLHGENPRTVHATTNAAGMIRDELARRDSARQHSQTRRHARIAAYLTAAALIINALPYVIGR